MNTLKRIATQDNDELRSEYDLKSLQVRRLGPGRKAFGKKPDLKEDQDREYSSDGQTEDTADESDLC